MKKKRTMHELMYRAIGAGNTAWLYLYSSLAAEKLHPAPKHFEWMGQTFTLRDQRKVKR